MIDAKLENQRTSNNEELPIVLLSGTSAQSEDWSHVLDRLGKHRTVARINYADLVSGTDPGRVLTVADYASRVVEATKANGMNRFDLVGYSLGASVASVVAANYPEMVRNLILISGFSHGYDPRMKLQFDLWQHLLRTDKIALAKLLLVSGLSREFLSRFDENTIDGIIKGFVETTDWPVVEQNIKVDLIVDVQEEAKKIKARTLAITATHDQIVPTAYSLEFANLIPNSERAQISSGHLSFLENPVDLASVMLAFLTTV